MSDSGKAVFLSYASQDAEAAKRIAGTLRAAGVEVWFDAEGGLEHGDEWDAKIRRQIKECVLFLPIISANTEAREEGYFRIEWELAAQRALGIASGVAFILPIVIDDTREPDALVPDRFRTVQWTRARGGELTPEVKARFPKLWSHRAGVVKHQAETKGPGTRDQGPGAGPETRDPRTQNLPKPGWKAYAGLAVAIFALVAAVGWWLMRGSSGRAGPGPAVAAADAQFPQDPELAKAMVLVETLNSTMEDHTLAEDLAKAVLVRKPTDPETVIVNAYIENRFILRGFDVSDERHATARRLSERAFALAPVHPEALHVLGQFLFFRQADAPRAVDLLRRAVTLQPDHARFYNSYIEALETVDPKEALRVAEAAAARFPADPIIHYRLALVYAYVSGDLDAYERALDETLAIGPVATAVIRKAGVVLIEHRDVARAKRLLDQMPGSFRLNDRAVYARYLVASASGDVDDALRTLNALPGNFLSDFGLWPKRMLTGDLLARKGQADLARREFEAALADIARERVRNPNAGLERSEKWLLLWLGRDQEARASANLIYEGTRRPVALRGLTNMWFNPMTTLLVLGERAKALELLREAAGDDWGRRVLAGAFALDPHLTPWRNDPEINALLADPAKQARDWPKDPELKRVMPLLDRLDAIPEDFRLAEEIVQKALDKSPTDPEVMTAMARVQSMWLLRGWDNSEERFQLAKKVAERAAQLAPDSPEALGALGIYLNHRGGEQERARQALERAIALVPDEPFYHRMLGNAVFTGSGRTSADALATVQRTAARFPRDALAQYDLARYHRDVGNWVEFERALDATMTLAPVANALVWKARAEFAFRDDLPAMKATLDRVPARVRAIERTVFTYFIYAVMSGRPAEGLEAVQMMSDLWMADFDYRGPKALLTAELLKLQGKPAMARLQYEAALVEVQKRKSLYPGDAALAASEAWVLHGLGRDEEARAANKVILESIPHPYRMSPMNSWWFQPIPLNLVLGERATALQLIRETVKEFPPIRGTLRQRFQLDGRMAPFRDDPEIRALLAEPGAPPSPARQLAAQARALLQGLEATREDYAFAEEYCQQALKLDPGDGEVWATYSQVHGAFGYRGWDTSPERREQVRVTAERAIRLAPDTAQAKIAQAGAWSTFGLNRAETEKLLRDVVAEQPDNQAALRFLAVTLLNQGKLDECLALNESSAALPGGDPLALFNNARYLWQRGRRAEAYAFLQRSLAQKPFSGSLTFRTMMEIVWRGDLVAAEETLRQIPQATLLEDRANYMAGLLRYYQRRPARAIEAWSTFPRDYYMDFVYDGPKGLLIGLADEMDHRDTAAKIEWRTALQAVEKRLAATPNQPAPYYYKAYLLACLGEKAPAEEALRTCEELSGIKYTTNAEMTFDLALVYARLDRFDEIFAQSPVRFAGRLRVDPRFDALRDDPRYAGLMAELDRQKTEAAK